MAPLSYQYVHSTGSYLEKDLHKDAVVRSSELNSAQTRDVTVAEDSAGSPSSPTVYLAIGAALGGAILIALLTGIFLTVKKRNEHRRMMEALEVEEAVQFAQRQEVEEIPRPVNVPRCNPLVPLQARAGWDALASDETIHDPGHVVQTSRPKRASVSLPKKFKQQGISLKKLKRLTAIMESPRSKTSNSPALPFHDAVPAVAGAEQIPIPQTPTKAYVLRQAEDDDVFVCPNSPKPEVLPSFAIRSPGRYGAGIANNDNPRASRSKSVGTFHSIPDNALLGHTSRLSRTKMHVRSVSLGAPPTLPPPGPVPPLPIIEPHDEEISHPGLCASRTSSSSHGSAHSSVLVTSPFLKTQEHVEGPRSPSLDEVIALEDGASLKTVSEKQWQNPLITGPRRTTSGRNRDDAALRSYASIRSNIARHSVESMASKRLSSTSTGSSGSLRKHVSMAHIGLADQISISRVSSTNSMHSTGGVRKVTTPRKISRGSVSEHGSPAERKKNNVITRDISINSLVLPSRQHSIATQDSGRSSNGNPFQWDQPLPKPSALKGSPNARKGHRRQNCVRISTLTPQILGPPPSRPTSPSLMHGIEEETGDGDEAAMQPGPRFASNQRLSRPPSASSFMPNLTLRPLRASLTPSSPTLSAWTAFQEHGLPSQASDSQLSVSQVSSSPAKGTGSRLSERSSLFSIPSFPSPSKSTVSPVQLSQPVPEFCFTRPSTDIADDDNSPTLGLNLSSQPDLGSSPPLLEPNQQDYDPAYSAWPIVSIAAPKEQEYDPASPLWDDTEPERSSAFFPFATNAMNKQSDDEVSPRSRPTSYGGDMPDTPPISPKTMPEGFQAFFDKQTSPPSRAAEKLTSENASSIMARLPSNIDFPGAPILPPPEDPNYYFEFPPASHGSRQRSASNATWLQPMRPAPPPPIDSSPEIKSCMPPPLQVSGKTNLSGPREQPAQSVLKNAMALRRMNSEMNNTADRESRRYVRLGREASPLLPWIGSPDPNESCVGMDELFDFGFASDTREGASENPSALDEIDMTEVERKLDGALAGFDALPIDDDKQSPSVWDDGERFWGRSQNPHFAFELSSPLPGSGTPEKQGIDARFLATPKSIQNTPMSLYDSEGFLRT